ncbi:MAG TPA: VWA domain-containing protein, partial [Actinomycetales bacterium]|nr:VWA domain-containing protein [Actinomycetales bacterium]
TTPTTSTTTSATTPTSTSSVDGKLVLVLDASGSMEWDDASGSSRIEAAHSALHSVIDSLPEDANVGFRVFGATEVGLENPASCQDSQLLVPIGSGNKEELRAATEQYQPFGETPIGYALEQAAADLGTEGQRSILLVSDGESNCQPDPCEVARQLAADGIDLTINTVGMNVQGAAREHLQCVASVTGGTYFDASDAQTLTQALDTLALRAFRPFSITGTPVQGTQDAATAPTIEVGGQYTDTIPPSDTTLHYAIPRQFEGSSIHVGLTTRTDVGNAQFMMYLSTPSGEVCGRGNAFTLSSRAAVAMLSGSLVAPGGHDQDDECITAEELILSLESTRFTSGSEGTAFEFVVTEEPRRDLGTPPPPRAESDAPRAWSLGIPADGSGGEVVAGSSFNDPTVLEPGSYRSEILTGETQVYAVEVDWGQQVRAQAHVDAHPFPGPGTPILGSSLEIYSPQRGAVSDSLSRGDGEGKDAVITRDTPQLMSSAAPTVQWDFQNNISSRDAPILPGTYYVVLSLDERDSRAASLPYTLSIEVVGEAGAGAPVYDPQPIGQASPSPEPSPTPSPEVTTTPPPAEETSPAAVPTTVPA